MADWPAFWINLRARVNRDSEVTLTIDEILQQAGSRDRNVGQRWWWDMLENPNAESHTGLLENGLDCSRFPSGDEVSEVTFRVRMVTDT